MLSRSIPTLASITRVPGGYVAETGDKPIFIPRRDTTVLKAASSTGRPPGRFSLYPNWVNRGGTFVGFGSLGGTRDAARPSDPRNPDRPYRLGFLRGMVAADPPQFFDVEVIHDTEANDLYVLGMPLFAASDQGLFVVRLDGKEAFISRVAQGQPALERLAAFPERFRNVPQVDPMLPITDFFEQIEEATMAAGLFGQGDYLYLLTREKVGDDATQWLLHQIVPGEPKPRATVRLPTRASFLSIAVGPTEWFLVERSKVLGWGEQEIKTLVRVPTSWIASPATSPLNADDPRVLTCPLTARRRSDRPKPPRPPSP